MNSNLCNVCATSIIVVIIGAINWGLIGIGGFLGANWNVVYGILGSWPILEGIVYILIGVAGIMTVVSWNKCCLSTCQRRGWGER